MIRFSAALVAVAIGVLIGGIATSKLVLVYIAIAASAVALVALAIGVMLKREELFGEGQGIAPAQAGATPVLPARAGESHDQGPNGLVTPPPAQGAAVGPGAAFADRTLTASARPGTPWAAAPAAPDAWPAPAAPTAAVPAMWQAPPVPAGATVGGWGTPAASEPATVAEPVAQGSATATRQPWDTPAPSVFAARSTEAPPASPGGGAPNWFDPADRPASAETAAPGAADAWSWPGTADKEEPAEAVPPAADAADDDWPTRYSWLDEEPEGNGASGDDKPADAVTVIASEPALAGDATAPADVVAPEDAEPGEPADAEAPAPPALRLVARDPGPVAETAGTAGTADATDVLETAATAELSGEPEPEREPDVGSSATAPDESTAGTGLVTVVRGVPRFHEEDCVLIRFMPPGDTQKLPVAEARAAGCTPCAACQPEG